MPRLKGWERRYIELAQFELGRSFHWVNANCGHLMAASIRACHGEHPVLDVMVGLTSQEHVEALVQQRHGISNILSDHFEQIPTLMAQQADIGIFVGRDGTECGCIILDGQAVGKSVDSNNFRLDIDKMGYMFRI